MRLKIEKDPVRFNLIISKDQLDYDSIKTDDLLIFIYGYPIDFSKRKWASPDIIKDYYQSGNWDFLDNIDGVFSIVIADKSREKIFVVSDRLGIYTLFFYQTGNQLIISDRISEIKDEMESPQLNQSAVLELLNIGFKIGSKTLFHDLVEFEPARIYEFDAQFDLKTKEYWSIFDINPSQKVSKEEFREIFNSNLDVVSDLEDDILFPISGGKDTRMLLSSILNKKDKLHSFTGGTKNHSDIVAAKKICENLGISRHSIYEYNNQFGKEIDFNNDLKNMNVNGCGPYFFHIHVKKALEGEQGKASLILRGDLGNQTWRHHPFGRAVPNSMDPQENALWMMKNLTRVLYFKGDHRIAYKGIYKNNTVDDVALEIQNSIAQDLGKLTNPQIPSDYSEYFILRTLAYGFYSNILKFIGKYFKLFISPLQKDLLQQLHLLSISERVDGGHIDYIIAKNSKTLSGMPYYNSGRVLKYIKLISNSLSQKAVGANIFNHPELHNYPLWIRKYHKDSFYKTLNPDNMVLSDMFDGDTLKKHVEAFLEAKYSITSKKNILLKFSNQHFVYNLFSLEHLLQNSQ